MPWVYVFFGQIRVNFFSGFGAPYSINDTNPIGIDNGRADQACDISKN
jgi:hypothetical protein